MAEKPTIVFVHHGKGIGGAPLTLLTLMKSIDRSKYDVHVLCLFESEASALFRREGFRTEVVRGISLLPHTTGVWYGGVLLPVFFFRLALLPFSILRALRVLRRTRPNLVHLNSSSLLPFAIAARWLRIPVVTHVLEHLHRGYLGVRQFLISRLLVSCSSAVVCICRADAAAFPHSPKVRVIYDSVDPTQFPSGVGGARMKEELGIPRTALVVGMLGGISPIKGTIEFLLAAREILQRQPETYFVIAGVAPTVPTQGRSLFSRFVHRVRSRQKYRQRVQALAEEPRMKERVRFVEARWDVAEIIGMMDVLVFPSTVPHFARPLIEAAFLKKPVVASRLGGPEEIVVDGKTGLLVPPQEPEALAGAIEKILNDRPFATRMGEAGYQRAMELFHAGNNIPQLRSVLTSLLGGREGK